MSCTEKSSQHLLQGRREIFRFIKAHQAEFPVEMMCKVLMVSRSGYYYWLAQRPAKRTKENETLIVLISESFTASKKRYGRPKITRELRAKAIKVSRPRVARLMKKANLKSVVQQKFVVTTTASKHTYPVAENHLNRQFNPIKPGQAWVSDLTYIATSEGWLYLTILMDLYDRKVIGWSLSTSMKASETVIPAWQMALKNRLVERNLIFHSDRGVQYACHAFTRLLKKNPLVVQSRSGKGNCWDNAVAESFRFGDPIQKLKVRNDLPTCLKTREAAKQATFESIEIWYNRQRRHASLGYVSAFGYYNGQLQQVA